MTGTPTLALSCECYSRQVGVTRTEFGRWWRFLSLGDAVVLVLPLQDLGHDRRPRGQVSGRLPGWAGLLRHTQSSQVIRACVTGLTIPLTKQLFVSLCFKFRPFFRVLLGLQKNWSASTVFSNTPLPDIRFLPAGNMSHRPGTVVTIRKLTLTPCHHPGSMVCLH